MAPGPRAGWDLLAAIAATTAFTMFGVYIAIIRDQGGDLAIWFTGGLLAAAVLALYGVARTAPRRRPALTVSGAVLIALGFLGILTIGLPVLVAGGLAVAAAVRDSSGGPTGRSA